MTETATVETLTAEVRVLMVGNRQITLSVFRQLDRVPLAEIQPFGRVNDGEARDGTWVVGRSAVTGELVRTHVEVCRPPTNLLDRARDAAGRDESARQLVERADAWLAASALPLIVLAGLR
jgi:hypothetical protein